MTKKTRIITDYGAMPATLDEWRAAKADPRMADPSPRLTLFKRTVDPSEADGRGVLPSGVFGVRSGTKSKKLAN